MSATVTTAGRSGLTNVTRSAAAFGTASVASGLSGLVFWVIAARMYPAATLGRDALLVLLVRTIAAASDLNLNAALPRLLPQLAGRRGKVVGVSYAAAVLTGALFATGFVLLAPAMSTAFAFLAAEPALAVALVAGVPAWGVFALQDNVLVAVRRPGWVPVENLAFGLARIGLVAGFAAFGVPHGVLLAWLIPLPALIALVNLGPVRAGLRDYGDGPPLRLRGRAATGSTLTAFLAYDYAALLVQQAGMLLMPVIITARLGPAQNGWFSVAFSAILALETVLLATAAALAGEAAARPDLAAELVRTGVRRIGAVLALTVPVGVVATGPLLRIFGQEYAVHAAGALRVLVVTAVPLAVLVLRATMWRVEGRSRPILAVQAAVFVGLLAAVPPAADRWGLTGVAWSWCGALAVPALCVLPALIRAVMSTESERTGER